MSGGVSGPEPTLTAKTHTNLTPNVDRPEPVANQIGLGHIAFEVEDIEAAVEEVVTTDVPGRGQFTFACVRDPEGNIIELQRWT